MKHSQSTAIGSAGVICQLETLIDGLGLRLALTNKTITNLNQEIRDAETRQLRLANQSDRDRACYRTGAAFLPTANGHLVDDFFISGLLHLGVTGLSLLAEVAIQCPNSSMSDMMRLLSVSQHGSTIRLWGVRARWSWLSRLYHLETIIFRQSAKGRDPTCAWRRAKPTQNQRYLIMEMARCVILSNPTIGTRGEAFDWIEHFSRHACFNTMPPTPTPTPTSIPTTEINTQTPIGNFKTADLRDLVREAASWQFRRARRNLKDRAIYRIGIAFEMAGGHWLDDVFIAGLLRLGALGVRLMLEIAAEQRGANLCEIMQLLLVSPHGEIITQWGVLARWEWLNGLYRAETAAFQASAKGRDAHSAWRRAKPSEGQVYLIAAMLQRIDSVKPVLRTRGDAYEWIKHYGGNPRFWLAPPTPPLPLGFAVMRTPSAVRPRACSMDMELNLERGLEPTIRAAAF